MQFPNGAVPGEKEREEPHGKEESLCKIADKSIGKQIINIPWFLILQAKTASSHITESPIINNDKEKKRLLEPNNSSSSYSKEGTLHGLNCKFITQKTFTTSTV